VENALLSFELLFETLQSFGVKCVIVGLLPHSEKILPKRGLTMTEYNQRVDSLNEGLHVEKNRCGLYILTSTRYTELIFQPFTPRIFTSWSDNRQF
jgi:hypothetical protein